MSIVVYSGRSFRLDVSALAIAAVLLPHGSALAQTAPVVTTEPFPAAIQLPPIVVQGATLERPRVTPPKRRETATEADPAPTPPAPSQPSPSAAPPAPAAQAPASQSPATDSTTRGDVAGIPVANVGTAVTIVTGEELRAQQTRTAADALRGLPGVEVSASGSVGSLTQVRIRGAEGRHTRVIVDGVEVNTTKDGEFDFSNLSPEDIERIEVIRGPMSSLYGSGAIGGVINITTRAPQGPLTLGVRTEYGSFGTRDIATRLSVGNEQAYVAISSQIRDVRGYPIAPDGTLDNGTRLAGFAMRAGAAIGDTGKLDIVLRNSEKRAEYDDFGGTRRLAQAVDAPFLLRDSNWLVGATLRWDMLNRALTQEVKINQATSSSVNTAPGYQATDDSVRTTFGYAATYRLDTPAIWAAHAITGQVERRVESYTPTSSFNTGLAGDGLTRSREQTSYAGEWRGTFAKSLTLTAGARHDANTTFQDFNTWRTSASWAITGTGFRPHASLGTAVKLPGMYDQFGPEFVNYISNPNLRPEQSRAWDGGVEWSFFSNRALIDVTYFRADLTNKIGVDYNNYPFIPVNADGISKRGGVEVSGRWIVSRALSLGAAYTHTDARRPDGTPELRRAPHGGRVDAKYLFAEGRGTASMVATYNGRAPDSAFVLPFYDPERVALRKSVLLTAATSYKLQPNVEVYGRLENLLGERYQEAYGYNTAGRAAYVGLKINLQDTASKVIAGKP